MTSKIPMDRGVPLKDPDGWPLEIPWPVEGEFCKGIMKDNEGRCCLVGWIRVAFTGDTCFVERENPCVRAVVEEMASRAHALGSFDITTFNDSITTTDAQRARLWADTWHAFGYEAFDLC